MMELVNNTKESIQDFHPMHISNPESIYFIECMSEKVQHLNPQLNYLNIIKDKSICTISIKLKKKIFFSNKQLTS